MSEKMRKEFEAWAQRHHGIYSIGHVNGNYSNQKVADDWLVWRASRRSQQVGFPDLCFGVGDEVMIYKSEMKLHLDAAGVKYE
jgi:hypothetical protein